MYVQHVPTWYLRRSEERGSDLLDLSCGQLSCHVGAGNRTSSLQEQQVLLAAEPLDAFKSHSTLSMQPGGNNLISFCT